METKEEKPGVKTTPQQHNCFRCNATTHGSPSKVRSYTILRRGKENPKFDSPILCSLCFAEYAGEIRGLIQKYSILPTGQHVHDLCNQ